MVWLYGHRVSFDCDFYFGDNPEFYVVRITPDWDLNYDLHRILKRQFEDFHLKKG